MGRKLLFIIPWFFFFVVSPGENVKGQCPVTAAFSWDNSCEHEGRVTFIDNSTAIPPAGQIVSWEWSFGDGGTSTAQNPTYNYGAPGFYDVVLTVYDVSGCSDAISHQVYVPVLPEAGFSHSPEWECASTPVQFNASSSSGDGLTYTWDFGDGRPPETTTYDTISHKFWSFNDENCSVKERFQVTLTVTDSLGCSSSITRTVTVIPMPVAALLDSLENEWYICHSPFQPMGMDTLWVNDSVPFEHCVNYFSIDWGDGTDTNNLSLQSFPLYHVYNSYGTFPLTYYVHGVHNCDWDTTYYIKVVSYPTAYVDVTPVEPGCAPYTVQYTLSGNENNADSTTYSFNFGDGSAPITWSQSEISLYDTLVYTYTDPHCTNPNASINGYHAFLHIDDNGICGDTIIFAQNVEVYESPVAAFTMDQDSICFHDPICFDNLTIPGYTYGCAQEATYVWDFGDGSASSEVNPCHYYTQPGDYIVTLTAHSTDECFDDTSMLVHVYDYPVASLSVALFNCQDDSVVFTDLSIPGSGYIASWLWDFGDGGTSTQQHPTHVYTSPGQYTTTLTVWNSKGCVDDTSISMEVWELPYADFSDSSHCDYTVYFTDHSDPHSTFMSGWFWDFGDGSTSSEQHPIHTYDTSGIYTVSLTVTNSHGCHETIIKPVTVHPLPVAGFSVDPICLGYPTQFTDLSAANYGSIISWVWDFGDGGFSIHQNPSHTYAAPGTYTVTLTIITSENCVSTVSHDAMVWPLPVADFEADTVCMGYTTSFIDKSTPNAGSMSSWFWDFDDGTTSNLQNPTHIFSSYGTYDVSLSVTNSNGCTKDTMITIEVYPPPIANFSDSGDCNYDIYFTDLSIPRATSIINWNWDFGDGHNSSLQHPVHEYDTSGTYMVRLIVTNSNGCIDSITYPVIVHPLPIADFIVNGTCVDYPARFFDQSVANYGIINSWEWDFGDGSTSSMQNPTHLYSTPGSYLVRLIIETTIGCRDTAYHMAEVYPLPEPNFTASPICDDYDTYFTDLSNPRADSIVAWYWQFGDGYASYEQHPHHVYASPGFYNVTLAVQNSNGCIADTMIIIEIYSSPSASFYNTQPVCLGDSVYFYNTSTPGLDTIVEHYWEFGDGHTSYMENPVHLYNAPGPYEVTLLVTNTNGCTSYLTRVIYINEVPTVDFAYTFPCWINETHFEDLSTLEGSGSIIQWIWDFDDGVISYHQNPVHTFPGPGIYNVSLTAITDVGCSSEFTKAVTIYDGPRADFVADTFCVGYNIDFLDQSTPIGEIVSWYWDFGDPGSGSLNNSSLQHPEHTYNQAGNYTVTLTVTDTNGCFHSKSHTYYVEPNPLSLFTYVGAICPWGVIEFYDLSQTYYSDIIRWEWDFGDGTTEVIEAPYDPNTAHVYSSTGTYAVSLTIFTASGCSDTYYEHVLVRPGPDADFNYENTCLDEETLFFDNTSDNDIISWVWDFGDPVSGAANYAYEPDPTHVYSSVGTYNVQLIVMNSMGCDDTIVKTVEILPPPPVDFSWLAACEDTITWFYVDSSVVNTNTIIYYLWDFGDGYYSNLANPGHVYDGDGSYNVTLHLTDTSHCENSITYEVVVYKKPYAFYDITEPTCIGDSIFLNNLSSSQEGYIERWIWDYDDGTPNDTIYFPNDPNVSHIYQQIGNYAPKLTVTNTRGCSDSYSRELIVRPHPIADYTHSYPCEGGPVTFTDLSVSNGQGNPSTYHWDFGDPASGIFNTSDLQNPDHIFANGDSTYTVTLIITNFFGCSDTMMKTIYVNDGPPVDFGWSDACEGMGTTFYPDSSVINVNAVSTWLWDFGDGTFGHEPIVDHVYDISGTFEVSLTITDSAVCSGTHSRLVEVSPAPEAMFVVPQTRCAGLPILFDDHSTSQTSYIYSWHWDFGDGNDTTIFYPDDPDVYHTYSITGTYEVMLTIQGADACMATTSEIISLEESPEADFSWDGICLSSVFDFYDQSVAPNGTSIISWSWDFDDPLSGIYNYSTQQSPSHEFAEAGTHYVSLLVENSAGCLDTTVIAVNVSAGPEADFVFDGNCVNNETTFQIDTTVTNTSLVMMYEWDFGDGSPHSSMMNPVHVYAAPGNYTVSLTTWDSNGCPFNVSHGVEVHPGPVAVFEYDAGCEGAVSAFTDFSYNLGNGMITQWHWNFGDPASGTSNQSYLQNPVHYFSGTGMYYVTLTVGSQEGCTDSITLPVNIIPKPEANFIAQVNACGEGTVYFYDETVTQADIESWHWSFGDGYTSSAQNPVHIFPEIGESYNVRLIVMDERGCSDTIIKEVAIPEDLDVRIYSEDNCLHQEMQFMAMILEPLPNSIYSYNWDFGDPASGSANYSQEAEPLHVFSNYGTYTVKLDMVDMFGCEKTIYKEVIVHELPKPEFTYSVETCDSVFYFEDMTPIGSTEISCWRWDFGDGSPVMTIFGDVTGDVTHTYSKYGVYRVTLEVTNANGCVDTNSHDVVYEDCMIPGFLADDYVCQHEELMIDVSGTAGPVQLWYFDFGDGRDTIYSDPATMISHRYQEAGSYIIRMGITAIMNGFPVTDTMSKMVSVLPAPEADFSTSGACVGSQVRFTDATAYENTWPVAWSWDFGTGIPGDTSQQQKPSFTYHSIGQYNVSFTAVNNHGCRDEVEKLVSVGLPPVADFEFTPGCVDAPVYFTDRSEATMDPIGAWEWNFGDQYSTWDTSSMQNPSWAYGTMNEKLVELVVFSANGCPDTIKKWIDIHPNPVAGFEAFIDYEGEQGRVALQDASEGALAYFWDFGDGYSVYDDFPPVIHDYEQEGSFMVEQVVWNEWGCTDTLTKEVDFMLKTLYIPNALNPDAIDPEVRVFKPKGRNLMAYHIGIYNGWGELIWESNALDAEGRPAESWDGTYEGHLVPTDVYIWKAEAIFRDGSVWEGSNTSDINQDELSTGTSGLVVVVR